MERFLLFADSEVDIGFAIAALFFARYNRIPSQRYANAAVIERVELIALRAADNACSGSSFLREQQCCPKRKSRYPCWQRIVRIIGRFA
jgi:hypothetical protein